jgi:hypothetical protein
MRQSLDEFSAQHDYERGLGPKPEPRESFSRHDRKCTICNHPERDAIDHHFLIWRPAEDIAEIYDIRDRSSIYRHAHATGLFERRRRTVRLALEPVIEQAVNVDVTADALVRAVRTYAQINDSGRFIGAHPCVAHRSPSARRSHRRVRAAKKSSVRSINSPLRKLRSAGQKNT